MAFTLSHPAAVIPLRKLPFLSLLPLIIGSMSPDLLGYLPPSVQRHFPSTHSPIGTVLIDLPLGYVLLLVLLLCKRPLTEPLWEPHRSVISDYVNSSFASYKAWFIAIPSLLIGSWTHIIWDRITHESYWTFRNMQFLYQPLFPDGSHQLPIYHVLQYLSSLFGLMFITYCYLNSIQESPHMQPLDSTTRARKILLLLVLPVISCLTGVINLLHSTPDSLSIYESISVILKTAIVTFCIIYLLSGLFLARFIRNIH